MKEFFAVNSKNEVFTPCDYRLVNAGFDLNHTTFDTIIKRVRKDYYLFCVDSGRVIVQTSKNEYTIVEEGEFFIYFPNALQRFWHEGSSKVKKTWVNFMGFECDEIIKDLKINEGKITLKQPSIAQETLQKLLKEQVAKAPHYEVMCKSLLLQLLTLLARDKTSSDSTQEDKPIYGTMMAIVDIINQNPHASNKELASSLNMSTDHFVRIFKSFFKITPHQYKLGILMDSAKTYLASSNLTVNQIAELLGYNNDGLYFNASFKKFVGVSPTEYRLQNNSNALLQTSEDQQTEDI